MKINEQLAEKEGKWGNFSRLIISADYSPQKMRFRKILQSKRFRQKNYFKSKNNLSEQKKSSFP